MIVGTLGALRRYPVKSLRGESVDAAEITSTGIAGDRVAAIFVREGHARAGNTYRGKENEHLHLAGDADAALALARERGVGVECRHGERYFDDAPISIVVDRWIEELSALLGYAVEWERFRPNFFVRATPAFGDPESALCGADLQLGGALLRVRSAIERCVTITYHPAGKPSDPNLLRVLAQQRGNLMGIYCDVVKPGIARAGDALARL